jgi:3-deoxy-D-manno-octulosonate 8-phosphate phosphatase (KDO 8-P phosphatase)
MSLTPELQERFARVRLLLMDVDGVLTDGRLYHFPDRNGEMVETKGFDSQDGMALRWLAWHGVDAGVISGRVSLATAERARQLDMKYVFQGHIEKVPILDEIREKSGVERDHIAYVGDDLTDIVVMRRVGLAIATANARPEVRRAAHYVTAAQGGSGAIREVAERILQAQGHWSAILEKYEVE